MNEEEKRRLWKNLRRIEGQVGGIGRMIDQEKGCGEILVQIRAAMSALKSVGRALLVGEAEGCFQSGKTRDNYVKLLKQFNL